MSCPVTGHASREEHRAGIVWQAGNARIRREQEGGKEGRRKRHGLIVFLKAVIMGQQAL
jgi:hypothetical protein